MTNHYTYRFKNKYKWMLHRLDKLVDKQKMMGEDEFILSEPFFAFRFRISTFVCKNWRMLNECTNYGLEHKKAPCGSQYIKVRTIK